MSWQGIGIVSTSNAHLAARFLQGHGIADRPFAEYRRLLPSFFTSVTFTNDPSSALEFVSLLSWPATRHVVFRASDHCTALINNSRNGSDYGDYICLLPKHLRSRFARVVSTPGKEWTNGVDRVVMQYTATIFDLSDSGGQRIRSVLCMNDGGRWTFATQGQAHPMESFFPYDHRCKRERFTKEHLNQLLIAFGLPIVTSAEFHSAGEYLLATSRGAERASTCTIEEADDPAFLHYLQGLTLCNHMSTHATSVIANFERCVRLNPDYAPKLRAHLERAYQQVRENREQ